jgi:hypothetical protein
MLMVKLRVAGLEATSDQEVGEEVRVVERVQVHLPLRSERSKEHRACVEAKRMCFI